MRIIIRQVRGRSKHPNWSGIIDEVKTELTAHTKPRLLKYFYKIVANWEHMPIFMATNEITASYIAVNIKPVGPNKQYWLWTSRGTRPHIIRPKNKPMLAWHSGGSPKTSPRGPSYGKGSLAAGPWVRAMEVHHPGTRPRHFEEAIGRWAKPWFKSTMEAAMKRGARRA